MNIQPARSAVTRRYKVTEIIRETADAVTIVFDDAAFPLSYRAGQFISVTEDLEGQRIRRCYSLSSSPIWRESPAITVKRVSGGLMSNHLNDNLSVGDELALMEPMGSFYLRSTPEAVQPVVLLAGGSGISPILSILKTGLLEQPKRNFSLCFANKSKDDVIGRATLNEIEEEFKERVNIYYHFDNEGGFLTPKKLRDWLKVNSCTNSGEADYYLCGPAALMDMFRECLHDLNVKSDHIHKEAFTYTPKRKIVAREVSKTKKTTTVLWNKVAHEIEFKANETLLDACLRNELPIPHSCRAGMCGMCVGRCLAGKIDIGIDENFELCLPEDSIKNGAILACISYPETESSCIAFDPITTSSLISQEQSALDELTGKEAQFDLFSSLVYGWVMLSLVFPLLMEFLLVPVFSSVFKIENVVLRTCIGGGLILVPFVVAPVIHIGEAYVFRLPARYELFGRVPILTTLKTPLLYFSGAILLWICIEFALSFSNGVYQTPTLLEMFVFLTIIQISNIFVMDLAFWIIHGPFGLHHPLVYEHLHAKHHRQRVSTFSTGPDLSPIDMLGEVTLFAVVPIGCGLALGFNSLEFMFCSLVNTLMISTWAHSPYNIAKIAPHASVTQYLVLIFPWLAENPHQGHHAKIECNYSIYGLWDKVFNTFQPMTEEDQNTARAIQETDLKKPKTLAFFYPKNSIAPYVEQLVSYAACLVVWYFLSVLNWQPIVRISDSILPFSN